MLVGWSSTLRFTVEGAVHSKLSTWPAGHVGIVAFHLAHTAHIACTSKASQLRVDRRITHYSSISRHKLSRHFGRVREDIVRRLIHRLVLLVLLVLLMLLVANDLSSSYGGML